MKKARFIALVTLCSVLFFALTGCAGGPPTPPPVSKTQIDSAQEAALKAEKTAQEKEQERKELEQQLQQLQSELEKWQSELEKLKAE